ncbi:MAG: pyridoxal-dependent decarboxylase [Chloroflexota bacterium]|nr:pyridoxal-dependent decarboxylase [Chloroflexota bacterium]
MDETNSNWHSELDDPEAFRAFAHEAVDLAADYLAALPERPVFEQMPPEARMNLIEALLPASGMPAGTVLDKFRSEIMPYPMGNGHPLFFGWVNSPPTAIGIVAELLAATMNPSCAGGDHAAIYLERATVRWLMEIMGFPTDGSMGILVSGGSMASLTGLATARQWASARDGWNARREGTQGGAQMTMYVSSETHTTVIKAAELLGIGSQYVRIIPADSEFRMDVAALETAVTADRKAGYRPFAVVDSAGTVSTGAIDPLDAIADLCAAHTVSGSTSTPPTAVLECSIRGCRRATRAWNGLIPSPSIRTSGCPCQSSAGACSCATAPCCGKPSSWFLRISRSKRARDSAGCHGTPGTDSISPVVFKRSRPRCRWPTRAA